MYGMQPLSAAVGWSFSFDATGQLKAGLFISLMSVWLLVGVFTYLNYYTRRRYFSIWTVAWLFYAVYLTLSYSLYWYYQSFKVEDQPWWATMLKQWCISTAAVFMLWGSLRFLGKTVRHAALGFFLCFLCVWSFVASYPWPEGAVFDSTNRLSLQIPIFSLIGLSSLTTVWGFYQYRRKRQYMGAGLLCFGFLVWGLFVAAYPFMERLADYMSTGFFVASVVQMFIAVNMIILVLEQIRYLQQKRAAHQLKNKEQEKVVLQTQISLTEERYRKLFEQTNEPIVITTTDHLRIVNLNAAAVRVLGLPAEEMPQHSLLDWFPTEASGPTDGRGGLFWFESLCRRRFLDLRRKDGGQVHVEVEGSTIDFAGESAFQFYLREVTERARLEQQLRRAEKLSGLGQMMSGVAHELTSPLSVIVCHAEIALLEDSVPPAIREHLEMAAAEGRRGARLLRNFLDLAREGPPAKENVDLNEIIQNVVELRRGEFTQAKIEIELSLAAQLPAVLANLDQIQQVLIILINNACQAMLELTRAKKLRLATQSEPGKVLVVVEDNGPGVPAHLHSKIFEPFYTTKPAGVGTGLGLSLAHTFLMEHRGRIFYRESSLGGAGFVMELPVVGLSAPANPPEATPPIVASIDLARTSATAIMPVECVEATSSPSADNQLAHAER
jgi:PAS domain S-box-containing protein